MSSDASSFRASRTSGSLLRGETAKRKKIAELNHEVDYYSKRNVFSSIRLEKTVLGKRQVVSTIWHSVKQRPRNRRLIKKELVRKN